MKWALGPLFVYGWSEMARVTDKLAKIVESAVVALGYELVGVEHISQGRHSVLRVYIDSEEGVTLDDCERVSHQLSGVLEVEDPIRGHYNLEISSPGMDRPLFTAAHYARFAGKQVRLRLRRPLEGRRNIKAMIERVEGEHVIVRDTDTEAEMKLPLRDIEKGNLIPEF